MRPVAGPTLFTIPALILLLVNLAVMLSYNALLEGAYRKRMG